MEIALLVVGAVLLMTTAILSQTLTGKWKIVLWIVFTILLIAYTILGIQMELDRKVEKSKEDTNISDLTKTNQQVLGINKELLQIVKSPDFGKNPETLSKVDNIERNLSSIENKSKVILQFTLLTPEKHPTDNLTVPIKEGVVEVAFSAKNISTQPAKNADMWIQICDQCKYAEENKELEIAPSNSNTLRITHFYLLNAGVNLKPIILKIIPPSKFNSFPIGFYYTCETCLPADINHPQKFTVNY